MGTLAGSIFRTRVADVMSAGAVLPLVALPSVAVDDWVIPNMPPANCHDAVDNSKPHVAKNSAFGEIATLKAVANICQTEYARCELVASGMALCCMLPIVS